MFFEVCTWFGAEPITLQSAVRFSDMAGCYRNNTFWERRAVFAVVRIGGSFTDAALLPTVGTWNHHHAPKYNSTPFHYGDIPVPLTTSGIICRLLRNHLSIICLSEYLAFAERWSTEFARLLVNDDSFGPDRITGANA
jgi:hypothetical protein